MPAQSPACHPERVFKLGSIAAFDFQEVDSFVWSQVVQFPHFPVARVERLLRVRARPARDESDHLVFILGQQCVGCRVEFHVARCAVPSTVARAKRWR